MHVNASVALARNCTRDVVADSKSAKTFAPAFAEGAERVRSLAALADSEDQRLPGQRCVSMTKLARVFYLGGDIRQPFDQIFSHSAGMESGAATGENDAPHIA